MSDISVDTPHTNRGVTHTSEVVNLFDFKGEINNLGQFLLIDWLQFTIHYDLSSFSDVYLHDNKLYISPIKSQERVYQLFYDVFGLTCDKVIYEKYGHNFYSECYSYKSIHVYTSDRVEMGINFEITGQGCRDIEELGISFFDLFLKLKFYNVKYSRIDLSIDDFTNRYFTLDKIKKCLNQRLIISKIRSFISINSGMISDNVSLGSTIQFGSKASLVHITFYDKLKERRSNNYIVSDSIKYWTRCEVRCRNEKATDVIDYLICSRDINTIVKGILSDYIRFLYRPKDCKDTNISRLNTANWWQNYIDNIAKLKLMPVRFQDSIQRKKTWLKDNISKTQFQVLLTTIPNIQLDNKSCDFLLDMLKEGYSRLKDKDIILINEYRKEQGLVPITSEDIRTYLRDIKNVLLVSDNDHNN